MHVKRLISTSVKRSLREEPFFCLIINDDCIYIYFSFFKLFEKKILQSVRDFVSNIIVQTAQSN